MLAVDLPGKNLAKAHDGKSAIAILEKSVGDADAADVIVDHAIKSFGKLDIVMNNAGISGSVLVG